MKFACRCGAGILDQTDYVPYKGHLVSDQDAFDALEASRAGSSEWFARLARAVYECRECGRLWLTNDARERVSFVPEERTGRVIFPAAGDRWRAPLRASWRDRAEGGARGHLDCAQGGVESSEEFDAWEDLERAYHRLLEQRAAAGTLRDALLTRNDVTVHEWTATDAPAEPES